jgi:hypothetical protein
MAVVQDAVYELTDAGVSVLSPADPRVVDQFGDFVFVASDFTRTLRTVEDRHLAAIAASDFLWLVAPDGYVGLSAAMEIGFAAASGTPIFTTDVPCDLTTRQYVSVVPTLQAALLEVRTTRRAPSDRARKHVLLDPYQAIEQAHADLEVLRDVLTAPGKPRDRLDLPAPFAKSIEFGSR